MLDLPVAIIDDEKCIGNVVAEYVKEAQCTPQVYTDPDEFLCANALHPVDVVITDLKMPNTDGLAVLRQVKKQNPPTDVIILSGYANKAMELTVRKYGALELIRKPFRKDDLIRALEKSEGFKSAVAAGQSSAGTISLLSERETKSWGIGTLVGKSDRIHKILCEIRLLHNAPGTSVMITGESGTGKELVARAIHFGGYDSSSAFVPVNCSAIPVELAESILFGHIRGAFTGASCAKKGAFEIADGGTLLLDEIGDMPYAVQTKLLRVLEDGIVVPVGKSTGIKVDVRILASTNVDLCSRVQAGTFRSDLYHRLAAFTIELPPLRERREDIPLLAEHFGNMYRAKLGLDTPFFSEETLSVLQEYDFPGNIRELKYIIERAFMESGGADIEPAHLHFNHVGMLDAPRRNSRTDRGTSGLDVDEMPLNLHEAEAILIREALCRTVGNLSAAARLLGISRTKLYRKLPGVQQGLS